MENSVVLLASCDGRPGLKDKVQSILPYAHDALARDSGEGNVPERSA